MKASRRAIAAAVWFALLARKYPWMIRVVGGDVRRAGQGRQGDRMKVVDVMRRLEEQIRIQQLRVHLGVRQVMRTSMVGMVGAVCVCGSASGNGQEAHREQHRQREAHLVERI